MKFEDLNTLIAEGKIEEATTLFNTGIEAVIAESSKIDDEKLKEYVSDINNGTIVGGLFKSFADNPKNESLVNPIFDKRVTASKEKMEKNFMEKEFPKRLDAKIKELYPDDDPKDQKLAQMQLDMDNMKLESKQKDQMNLAISKSGGMFEGFEPARYIGDTDEDTELNIEKVKSGFEKAVLAAVEANNEEWKKKIGDGSIPGGSQDPNLGDGKFDFNKPWKDWSMTERSALYKKDPKKFDDMQKAK